MSQNDPFLHKTVRAEWWVLQSSPKGKPVEHGPFPNEDSAYGVIEILRARALTIHKFDVQYRETEVDIDPILALAVDQIAKRIEGWIDEHMIQNKKRRNTPYLAEGTIRRSLQTLANKVKETFALNLENPHASSETHQRR